MPLFHLAFSVLHHIYLYYSIIIITLGWYCLCHSEHHSLNIFVNICMEWNFSRMSWEYKMYFLRFTALNLPKNNHTFPPSDHVTQSFWNISSCLWKYVPNVISSGLYTDSPIELITKSWEKTELPGSFSLFEKVSSNFENLFLLIKFFTMPF